MEVWLPFYGSKVHMKITRTTSASCQTSNVISRVHIPLADLPDTGPKLLSLKEQDEDHLVYPVARGGIFQRFLNLRLP